MTWSEQPQPKDVTKKELMTELPAMWKGFSDLKFTVTDSWAAGDYVAALETFDGTNDGDLPMMHVKKTGKKVSLPVPGRPQDRRRKGQGDVDLLPGDGTREPAGSAAPPTIAKSGKDAPTPTAKPVKKK